MYFEIQIWHFQCLVPSGFFYEEKKNSAFQNKMHPKFIYKKARVISNFIYKKTVLPFLPNNIKSTKYSFTFRTNFIQTNFMQI